MNEKTSQRLGESICKDIVEKGLYPVYMKNSQKSIKENLKKMDKSFQPATPKMWMTNMNIDH